MTAAAVDEAMAVSGDGITVTLGGRRVVDEVTFGVAPGEWLNVVGPNGAGKSTLLRVIAGLQEADGHLEIDGHDSRALRRRDWSRRVALVPQSPLVPTGMTVAEYVLLGRTPHMHPLGSESAHDVDMSRRSLERLDLMALAHRTVDTLSGGERQRVMVARLLAQDAPIALLDEPISSLDVGHQQQVLDLVEDLRRDRTLTVIATMHDLTLAGQYGDRVALLVEGRLVTAGAAADVMTEAVLTEHYGARVRVIATDDGPLVVPVRSREDPA